MKADLLLLMALCSALSLWAQEPPDILWQDAVPYGYTPTSVAISPDGTYVAGPGGNGVQIWRVADGAKVISLTHGSWVGALTFSPDGQFLAAGGGSPPVCVWRVSDWSLAYALTNDVSAGPVVFSPDSSLLAVTWNYAIQLRQATNGALLQSWTNGFVDSSLGGVVSLAFSPDGTRLASGAGYRGKDTNFCLWGVPSGQLLLRIPTAQTYNVGCVAFSPDGQFLATAGGSYNYGPLQLWRAADGALVRTFPDQAFAAAFSPDGAQLAAIGTNIDFYAVPSGQCIHQYSDNTNGSYYQKAVAISPNGTTFLRTCSPGKILAARAPLWIHSFRQQANNWLLSWSGGGPNFQLQQRTNLLDGPWQDVGPLSTNRTVELVSPSPGALFRVIAPTN